MLIFLVRQSESVFYVCVCVFPGGFPGGSAGKEPSCDAGDLGLSPGLGRSPGEGNGISTPVLLPGKSHRQRSLVGYSLWGHKVSDMT